MTDKLNFALDIGMGDAYIDTFKKSQKSFDRYTNVLTKQNPSLKKEVDDVNNIKNQIFLDYGVIKEKQKTISITEIQKIQAEIDARKINTINQFKDVHSPADLSRLIDKQNDEGMKVLEEIIGTEALWKCILLTTIGTFSEIGKGTFDTFKIGGGAAEFTLIYENASATPKMRLEAMLKGVGIDALRAMAIIPGARGILQTFAKVLNNIKIPLKSTVGGRLIYSEGGFAEVRATLKPKNNGIDILHGNIDIKALMEEINTLSLETPDTYKNILINKLCSQKTKDVKFLKEPGLKLIAKFEESIDYLIKIREIPATNLNGIKNRFLIELKETFKTYNLTTKFNNLEEAKNIINTI